MNIQKTIIILLLAISCQLHAQLQLVDLGELKSGMEHHQSGKIPIFKSSLKLAGKPKINLNAGLDVYDPNNLLAAIDGQLVVFPKAQLAISNGFKPFKDLMGISNGFLQLKNRYGVGVWTDQNISNGFLYFRGFASLKSFHVISDTAVTMTWRDYDPAQSSTELVSDGSENPDDPVDDCRDWGNCDDDEHDFELWWFLEELNRNHNPWDRIMVMLDGVMVEMSVGAVSAHLNNGAFRLGGGDGRMPEFP
ncbi:hypothetical protein ACFODZ_13610 [Marinicella sediminis]|uniref:Uncharacterized protein n=1 Tax=Marinicella sediminis TaxID=1792834 RepID=A0ABV7JEJ8_9GAMM|nr:hypothetical protein [Marinicella sediminis]